MENSVKKMEKKLRESSLLTTTPILLVTISSPPLTLTQIHPKQTLLYFFPLSFLFSLSPFTQPTLIFPSIHTYIYSPTHSSIISSLLFYSSEPDLKVVIARAQLLISK